jgi:hypothetical protein
LDRIEASAERLFDREYARYGCQYPTEGTWAAMLEWGDVDFLEDLSRRILARHLLAVTGPFGTGKTFHVLLAAFKWQARVAPRSAFYALAPSEVDVDHLYAQWEALRDRECLWIIDEAQEDLERSREIVHAFRLITDGRHSLVVTSWCRVADMPTIALGLKASVISRALRAESLPIPSPTLMASLERSALGLREILWAAREGMLGQDLTLLERECNKRFTEDVSASQRELLFLLARLKFLCVPLHGRDPAETMDLRGLGARGIIAVDPSSHIAWVMSDEGVARRILRLQLFEGGRDAPIATSSQELAAWFLAPVRERVDIDAHFRGPELEHAVTSGLGMRTESQLLDWLGLPGGVDRTLLDNW